MGTVAAAVGGMGIGTAILGGAGISAVGSLIGGERAASAANRAARSQIAAQERMRSQDLALRRESRDLALQFAEATPEELEAISRTIDINQQSIAGKERLLSTIDPALMEVGKQTLALLQGQEAATLDPIRSARREGRIELENRLQAQLGTGYANSSAGIRALNDYDSGTDTVLATEQDRTLGRLLGVSQNVRQFSSLAPNIAASGTIAGLFGNIQNRQVNAVTGTPLSSQFAVQNSSANFAGEAVRAQAGATAFGQVGGALTLGGILGSLNPSNQSSTAGTAGTLGGGGGTPNVLQPFTGG